MTIVRKGATGINFDLLVKEDDGTGTLVVVDLSSVTAKEYVFTKPGGGKVPVTPSFKTNGSDGWLRYTSAAGTLDMDRIGLWKIEASLTFAGSGYDGLTTEAEFLVR
jgi:hypothetical protein